MDNCAAVPWTSTTLGAVATRLVNGGTPPTEEQAYWTGGLPWITGADFTQSGVGEFRRFVSEEAIKRTATNIVDKGSLLIVTRTGVGKLAIAPCDIAISQDITGVYPDRDQVDVEFLYHRMRQGVDDLRKLNQGTSINGIVRKDLISYPFELPPLNQQRRIANILSTVDQAIDQTEALIAKQQRIKAGLVQDLLTRGIDENGNLRSEETHEFKDSPLGRIPVEWESRPIGDIGRWFSGGTPAKANDRFWNGGVPWVCPKDMKQFELATTIDTITDLAVSSGARLVPPGTVFIVIRGMILAHTFPVGYAKSHMAFNQDVKAIVTKDYIDGRYLAYWLDSHAGDFLKLVTSATHGTKRFDMDELLAVQVGVPSSREQERIVEIFDQQQALIDNEQSRIIKLRSLKTALMQDLLTGQISVTPLLIEEERNA